jgi:hypothetical protein
MTAPKPTPTPTPIPSITSNSISIVKNTCIYKFKKGEHKDELCGVSCGASSYCTKHKKEEQKPLVRVNSASSMASHSSLAPPQETLVFKFNPSITKFWNEKTALVANNNTEYRIIAKYSNGLYTFLTESDMDVCKKHNLEFEDVRKTTGFKKLLLDIDARIKSDKLQTNTANFQNSVFEHITKVDMKKGFPSLDMSMFMNLLLENKSLVKDETQENEEEFEEELCNIMNVYDTTRDIEEAIKAVKSTVNEEEEEDVLQEEY